MKLPIIDEKAVVPVRFIPFITHGKLGREIIASILSHELKICNRESEHEAMARHEVTIARMAEARMSMKPDNGITPTEDMLSEDFEEEPCSTMKWLRPSAYRLNDEGKPQMIPVNEWRTVCLKIKPIIRLAYQQEDEIGIEGAKRQEWHSETLKVIPDDAFMWKTDLEEIYPADKLNYNVWIDDECKILVLEAFDTIINTEQPEPLQEQQVDRIEVVWQLVVAGRRARKNNKEIAVDIDKAYPGFSDVELGKLLAKRKHDVKDTHRKCGQRARCKVK